MTDKKIKDGTFIMKIGVFQLDTAYKNLSENREFIEQKLALSDADLVCAPELINSGYELGKMRERAANAPAIREWLSSLARKFKKTIALGSLAELQNDKLYNSLYIFGPDGYTLTQYRKIHLFTLTGEEKYFSQGDSIVTFNVDGFTIGCAICYDLRFPELFRVLRIKGAEAVIIPANWPKPRVDHWLSLGKVRAMENQMYTVGINRIGTDDESLFTGASFIFSPRGESVLEIGDTHGYFECELSKELVASSRTRLDSFRDRQPEIYTKEGL